MIVTKEIFEGIPAGKVFRVVTTAIQRMHEPLVTSLTFVCVKGRNGLDWAIYAQREGHSVDYIRRHGDKVHSDDIIRNICPCSDEVFELYRY